MNDDPLLRKSGIPSPDWLPGSTGGLPGPCARSSTCCASRRCRSAVAPSGSTSPPSLTVSYGGRRGGNMTSRMVLSHTERY